MTDRNLGIAFLGSAPLRAETSDRAEMVNVVLFGETFDILDKQAKWSRIRLHHDLYEGWIDNLQYQELRNEDFNRIQSGNRHVCSETVQLLQAEDATKSILIPQGSLLPLFDGKTTAIGEQVFKFEGEQTAGTGTREALVHTAYSYLNAPYLWGGRTPFGVDCSGFTQMVYRQYGASIPRDAGQQAMKGHTLSFLEECLPGDLAFFDNTEGAITHVGIVLEDGKIIHAAGRVRVDGLDQAGIYNALLGRHTHKLRVLKRLIP